MSGQVLRAALTTGAFCAVFAVVVDLATEMLRTWQVLVAGGISGFLGSLFASLLLRRER